MADIKFTDEEIVKALERCIECNRRQIPSCDGCLLEKYYPNCDDELEVMCLDLINRQKEKIDAYACINHLLEQDIADRDEMLKQKVEVVYADFMKDYECLKEELDGVYKELAELRAEIERLQKAIVSINHIAKKLTQAICDNTYPDFNRDGLPVNVWKAQEGYKAVDALVEQIAKEAMA